MTTTTTDDPRLRFLVNGRTVEDRFKAAWRAIRHAGCVTRLNVSSCCRSCAGAAPEHWFGVPDDQTDTTKIVWTYGGQGGRIRWIDGVPFYADRVRVKRWGSSYTRTLSELVAHEEKRTHDRPMARDVCVYHSGPGVEAARIAANAFRAEGFDVEWDGTEHRAVVVTLVPEDA